MLRQPVPRHLDIRTRQPHKSNLPTLLYSLRSMNSRRRGTELVLLEMLEHTTGQVGCSIGAERPGGRGVSLDEHEIGDILDHGAAPKEFLGPV